MKVFLYTPGHEATFISTNVHLIGLSDIYNVSYWWDHKLLIRFALFKLLNINAMIMI